MKLSVNTILSVFTLFAKMLEARAKTALKRHDRAHAEINQLIVEREEHASEAARATSAAKKLRDLTV